MRIGKVQEAPKLAGNHDVQRFFSAVKTIDGPHGWEPKTGELSRIQWHLL